jgi:hypothetical protein
MSKVAGVVDQVGLPEPSLLSFHGSAGRAMMRYNSAILGDWRDDKAEAQSRIAAISASNSGLKASRPRDC